MTVSENQEDFNRLRPEEQQAVAERLLRIEQSGWKPFWCKNPVCAGDPHPEFDANGAVTYTDDYATAGPNGEPVADVFEDINTGESRVVLDPKRITAAEVHVGRVVLERAWAHNHARADQRLPNWALPWILMVLSGRGCVAPWTLIDLADGTTERIDVLAEAGQPVQVQTPDGPRWTEGAPFLKGEAHMWRVRLSTGRVLTVTDEHRFLAPGGWLRLDHVRVGQPLVSADNHGTSVTVEAIEYSHFGPYFDMSVPGPEAYHSEGVVSHNTGKTRTGTEFVTLCARRGLHGAIIGRRGDELTNTHVAELIANAHPEFVPTHKPSKNLVEWPNGAITYLFSAERPENIRSVNLSYFWMDEAAFMDEVSVAWMNARLATRIETPGNPIHILVTSTPTGTKWVIEKEDDPDIEVRRVSTYANRANLSPDYIAALEKEYEGTRMGRQELHGEVLRDVPGALWNDGMFVNLRLDHAEFTELLETMDDIVVAVDPAGSANKRSDETGIIAVGVQRTDDAGTTLGSERYFVLADGTLKGTPSEWATRVYKVARIVGANRIIAEKNFGGDMVKQVLTDHIALHPDEGLNELGLAFPTPEVVHASEGKETRAESTVNKYEQCVDGRALVPTARGLVRLSEVTTRDEVLTRAGLRRVLATYDQGVQDVVEVVTTEGVLVLTADHRVFTNSRGWVHASDLVPTDTVLSWTRYASTAELVQVARRQSPAATPARPDTCGPLASRSGSFRSTGVSATTNRMTGTGALADTVGENSSIVRSGGVSEDRSRKAGTSTTSTTTQATTLSRTWSPVGTATIRRIIIRLGSVLGHRTHSTMAHVLARLGSGSVSTRLSSAMSAGRTSRASNQTLDSVGRPVTRAGGIVSIRAVGQRHVYDIAVEQHPEFFANGVLVHNCRVTHVSWGVPGGLGDLSALEKEQVTWVPKSRGGKAPSPNRIDATVWGVRALESSAKFLGKMATANSVMSKMRRRTPRMAGNLGTPGSNASGLVGPRGRAAFGGQNFRGFKTKPRPR